MYFYPRPPRGGRRKNPKLPKMRNGISIHALREEGDSHAYKDYAAIIAFLSTPSARRATVTDQVSHGGRIFLSTPSARRATQSAQEAADSLQISIHALREEGDRTADFARRGQQISIHALREEGDRGHPDPSGTNRKFLSTPSARRATRIGCDVVESVAISIHALREEGDILVWRLTKPL